MLYTFWNDQAGFVVSSELVLVATVLVVGLLAGLSTVRDQVIQELADVADAVSEVNQSYSYSGVIAHSASTAGGLFIDLSDYCEIIGGGATGDQNSGNEPQCVEINSINGQSE